MKVYQIRMKLYLLKDIPLSHARTQITYFLDQGLIKGEVFSEFHQQNKYKNYCYDLLYPGEKGQLYKKDQCYTLTVRTIDYKLAKHVSEVCIHEHTEYIKGLTAEVQIIPMKHINTLYTLTPAIIKDENGYWKEHMSLEMFENRLKSNLIKKWNQFEQTKLDEAFQFYTHIEFLNNCPVAEVYKNVKLLGDKISLQIADNDTAQQLAYMSLGTGIAEMNSRGFGFVNYRWL